MTDISMYPMLLNSKGISFAKMLDASQKSVTAMEEKITACTDKRKMQTANVKKVIEKMRKVESWQDMLLWISPIAVVLDLIVRIITMFS